MSDTCVSCGGEMMTESGRQVCERCMEPTYPKPVKWPALTARLDEHPDNYVVLYQHPGAAGGFVAKFVDSSGDAEDNRVAILPTLEDVMDVIDRTLERTSTCQANLP